MSTTNPQPYINPLFSLFSLIYYTHSFILTIHNTTTQTFPLSLSLFIPSSSQHSHHHHLSLRAMCQFDDDDNWVETAMADVNLVANFLLTMKTPSSSSLSSSPPPPLNLHWTVRQRRSKSRTRKMKTDSTRASPTTPLSWSAATSASAADGNEESSGLTKPVHTSRSKVRLRFSFFF